MLPLVPAITKIDERQARHVLARLWDTLLQLDDLTASTSSVMNLIAEYFTHMPSFEMISDGTGFENYIKRLWPFFRHSSHSVRRSVLKIFTSALRASQTAGNCAWLPPILSDSLHLAFVNIILEQRDDVVMASRSLWEDLLEQSQESDLKTAVEKHLAKWFAAMGTPPGVTLDPACLAGVQNAVRCPMPCVIRVCT
jgi:TATA-binding protein-associated factor